MYKKLRKSFFFLFPLAFRRQHIQPMSCVTHTIIPMNYFFSNGNHITIHKHAKKRHALVAIRHVTQRLSKQRERCVHEKQVKKK